MQAWWSWCPASRIRSTGPGVGGVSGDVRTPLRAGWALGAQQLLGPVQDGAPSPRRRFVSHHCGQLVGPEPVESADHLRGRQGVVPGDGSVHGRRADVTGQWTPSGGGPGRWAAGPFGDRRRRATAAHGVQGQWGVGPGRARSRGRARRGTDPGARARGGRACGGRRRRGRAGGGRRRTRPVGHPADPLLEILVAELDHHATDQMGVLELALQSGPSLGGQLGQVLHRQRDQSRRSVDEQVEGLLRRRLALPRGVVRCHRAAGPGLTAGGAGPGRPVLRHNRGTRAASCRPTGWGASRGSRSGTQTRRAVWAAPARCPRPGPPRR